MKLYNLHNNPTELDHHDDQDLVPILAWEKYQDNRDELKKREKILARDPKLHIFMLIMF